MTKLGFIITGTISMLFAIFLIINAFTLKSKSTKKQILGVILTILNLVFVTNALYFII